MLVYTLLICRRFVAWKVCVTNSYIEMKELYRLRDIRYKKKELNNRILNTPS